ISVENHMSIRSAADMNSPGFREIVVDLGALRRANPMIYHLYTLAPMGRLGEWGIVVDMGGAAPDVDDTALQNARVPCGSPAPPPRPVEPRPEGLPPPAIRILDLNDAEHARVVAVAPIRDKSGQSFGLAVVEMGAAGLVAEARLLLYVTIAIF